MPLQNESAPLAQLNTTGDNFAFTASKLLNQYTLRLLRIRARMWKIIDEIRDSNDPRIVEYIQLRSKYEKESFLRHRSVYNKLIRQSSQWLAHGNDPQPHLKLELEIRLADLEQTLKSTEEFFDIKNLSVR